jgi:hypothetical protein
MLERENGISVQPLPRLLWPRDSSGVGDLNGMRDFSSMGISYYFVAVLVAVRIYNAVRNDLRLGLGVEEIVAAFHRPPFGSVFTNPFTGVYFHIRDFIF